MKEKPSFLQNTVYTLGRQIINIVLGLTISVIIARFLGPESQGQYSLIILLPTLLVTFLNLGIGVSSVYYIGKKEFDLNTIYRTNITIGVTLSVIALSIGGLLIFLFSNEFFNGVPVLSLFLMLIIVPIMILKEYLQSIFQGLQDFKSFNVILLIGRILNLMLVIILLVIFSGKLNHALFAFAMGQVISIVAIFYLIKKKLKLSFLKGDFSFIYFKKTLSFGFKSHISNILTFLIYRSDILLISFFLNPLAVGIYTVAVSIAEKLWMLSQAISSVLFPKIASMKEDINKNKITTTLSRNILFISIFGGIILFLLSNIIIDILYGEAYAESSWVIKLLLPGIVLGSMSKIMANDISGRGKPEINMYTALFNVLSNLILNILLIPKYGIAGAAIATTITYSLNWLIKLIYFKGLTKVPFKSILLINRSDIMLYKRIIRRKSKSS